jgi:hypothetical protein
MSKDKNPKKNARREAKQRRRLPPDAVCSICGESAPHLLEEHHVMGQAHEGTVTIILCKNCHGKATEGQLREEVELRATDTFLERIAAIFGSLAAFFRFLAEAFDRLAKQVKDYAANLVAEMSALRLAAKEEN